MYESALRDLQQSVRQLENNIKRVVRRYESNLRDIQSSFKKINGSAEKQIEEEIARLKSDIDKILRDFERQIGNELHEAKKSITEQEKHTLRSLQDYKQSCVSSFASKARSLILVRGEL